MVTSLESTPLGAASGKSRRAVYRSDLKLAAVRSVTEEGMTYSEVVERFDIASVSTLKKWLSAYRRLGPEALYGQPRGRVRGVPAVSAPVVDPLDPKKGHRIRCEAARLAEKLDT